MDTHESGKNGRTLTLVYGDVPRPVHGAGRKKKSAAMSFSTAEFDLDRMMHDVFCTLTGADGNVPSEGVQEIRERRQWPWRVIARRFREARDAGVPASQLDEVIHVLQQYRVRLYASPTSDQRRRA